ncbi:HAD-IC family P-type ATPase [Klebsiella quasipneumoniae subsp. quasipneumoniae]|nr:HAD-IC family P-type ATPase [Klebsiella quasipneumoniae]MCD7088483.1 HAD-IC family P-type ATPase [Klebsiella quasipneumoniae subsp. quasipneumoniae]
MTKMNNPKFTTPSGDTAPRQVWQQTVDAVLAQTKSQAAGLSSADAAERLNTCGPNALPEKKGKPAWLRFLAHFNDVLIYVLLAAAALTAIMGHWVDTLVILGVTVINALIGHIQESNAEKSLQGIRNMLSSDARVQRNGKHETIPTRDLVPGDIVILRAGDRVPADMRLIETHNLRVEEAIITADCCYRVEGDSYEPQGRIFLEGSDEPVQVQPGTVLETWLRTIDLCNDSQLTQDERGLWGITGGPTEGALKVLAAKAQLPAVEARLVAKIPFDSQYKYMSTLQHIDGDARVLITGAPDVIFAMCREQMTRQGAVPFEAQYWEEEMARFARQGLRMVAAACKPASVDATTLNHEDLQEGLIFLGIAGMMDPPRPEAIDAIHACQTAGIRVKMITGDHPQTAMSIGQMLGITNSSQAMTGYQLEHMDDAALAKAAVEYDIFARTSPEHKLRLVKALQDNGEVVGMTGDGVNDAPALRQADVGIAMGIKGTEVTKEAADMVLTDDNFATIASSVKEGRRVYDNLKKTILFIMPTNLAQGLLIIIALLAGNMIPLTPVLILWMNMATSATLSFGLAFEAAERNVMNRPPRKTGQHVMDGFAVWRVAFVGSMIAIAAFILEAWLAPRGHSPEFIRTVLLQMLVTAQWVYMINCRSSDSFSLSMGLLRNKGIWLVTGVLLLMQLVIIYVPLMQSMFGTEALPLRYWFVTLVIGIAMFLVVEVEKRLTRRFRKTA